MELAVSAAIYVKIGNLQVTAVLATCGFSAIHERVFHKICQESGDTRVYRDVKDIELDIAIDGYSLALEVRVVPDLYVDMTLGNEFLRKVRSALLFDVGIFKWYCHNQVVVTKFVENDGSLRAISGGCGDPKYTSGSSTKVDCTVSAATSLQHEPRNGAVSSANAFTDKSSKTSVNSPTKITNEKVKKVPKNDAILLSGFRIALNRMEQMKNTENNTNKNETNKGWTKVFISEKLLIDMCNGERLGYYGVRWGRRNKNNTITGEVLRCKTMPGYVLEALHDIFRKASDKGIRYLHIFLENEIVVKLMSDYQKCPVNKRFQVRPKELSHLVDFEKYTEACIASEMIDFIRYEYVSSDDTTHKEMVQLRHLVQEFVSNTPIEDATILQLF